MAQYNDPTVDQPGWETAATSMGLEEVYIPYANEASVSPGAQLFILASTLFRLGMYLDVGQPNGNAAAWRDNIIL